MKDNDILVIDLFSGPGGLGEGFASYQNNNEKHPFKIGMSVEKDPHAHMTLTTRAFYRLAKQKDCLEGYYQYLNGKISRAKLFESHKEIYESAFQETLEGPCELGKDNDQIHNRVDDLVKNHKGPKILIGGPPCQAYSLAGRSRNAGNKNYVPKEDHRHFLYKEYLQVLSIAQPDIFVMENVRGILTAKVDNQLIFPQILNDLRNPSKITGSESCPSYRIYSLVEKTKDTLDSSAPANLNHLIRSEEFGIPQARHRVILLGVREDIKQIPDILDKNIYPKVSVKEAIGDLPKLRSGLSKKVDSYDSWQEVVSKNAETLSKLHNIGVDVNKTDLQPYEDLKRKETVHKNKSSNQLPDHLRKWILDPELNLVLNHETRGHMESDLLRYSFCALHGEQRRFSPKAENFPAELAPQHQNWNSGSYNDRFRVQISTKEATTITSHISKDGHYFIHYDPKQCRSLTVREAARLQTFPDNYIFEGNRTNQYTQVGNAVPPFLARQISEIVFSLLKKHYSNL
ncbi:DNA cytosine methyltransferase [Acinetobacter sp. ANC 4282]|uniref:DNA cytosine methyltransferase n=1 Tax=Acinetobacter terrae TaxID=2731247 RepID=UPI00148F778A|nr:DNA (cytosine-5-)-methyltransferase [Acinetobacter terrae]NNH17078.1 DNA cytosine methyltransferase [Acinetobacter terrae]